MSTALITLSNEGGAIIEKLVKDLPKADAYLHDSVSEKVQGERFSSILSLTSDIFTKYENLIYIAPCGVVVRAIAPHIQHKLTDPAVVVVDAGARYAISLLSGHEGGANLLAMKVANIINAEPIVTTTTEALKTIIAGIGCRRGVDSATIITAINTALVQANVTLQEIRLLASVDIKADEEGLLLAAEELGIPIRFISSEEIRTSNRTFAHSEFVMDKVNLPAVAEPAALLAGRRTQLLLPKISHNGVTVALARENSM